MTRRLSFGIVALLLAPFSVAIATAGPGALDPSFGTRGIVTTAVRTGEDKAYAVAVAPDGKIVSGGIAGQGAAVVRHLANGMPDTSFGPAGDGTVVDVPGGNSETAANAVAVHSDGRITMAGYFYTPGFRTPSFSGFRVSRLNANGTPDTSFGANGTVFSNPAGFSVAQAVLLQPDGKTVAVGSTSPFRPSPEIGYFPARFSAARFNADGSPDSGFNGSGSVVTIVGTSAAFASAHAAAR